jgi:phage shock protein A
MNIAQRFTLLVKGSINSALDSLEDPERSLHQLLLDMEEQLDAAKRATARAMANEDRLRARIETLRQDAGRFEDAARRALAKTQEADAREAMRRAEVATRQADALAEQLAAQERDTGQLRESVSRLDEQLQDGRARLQILQARIRQGEARRAMGKVIKSAGATNLHGEFERLGERVELRAAEESAYLRLDDQLSGRDFARRAESAAVDDAVEARLDALRAEAEEGQ